MGWDDFAEVFDEGAEAVGNLTEAVSTVEANALDSMGFHDLANVTSFLGEVNQFSWQTVGNFSVPVVDIVPTGLNYVGDSAVAFSELAQDLAHGDPDAWDNFNEAGEEINTGTWDEWTQGWQDAYNDTTEDFDDYVRDANEVYPSGPDNAEDLKDQWSDLLGLDGDDSATDTPSSSAPSGWPSFLAAPAGLSGASGGAGGPVSQGMNRAAAEEVAQGLAQDQQSLAQIIEAATAAVNALGGSWHGPDSTKFQQQWTAHARQLQACVDQLGKMRAELSGDINEQRGASSA